MKITVVVAVLNAAEALERTLAGLKSYSGRIDCIVVDGGSRDGSIEVIEKHADGLACWVSEPDRGVYDAMNKGWALAAADSRILFLGAGDQLLSLPPVDALPGSSLDILYGNVCLESGRVFHARAGVWLRLYNSIHHQALLIPKGLHPEPPFDLSFPLYADFDFNQRLLRQGCRFRFEPALSAYAAPAGLTEKLSLEELSRIIRRNYGFFWCSLSQCGFALARRFSLINRLHPVR